MERLRGGGRGRGRPRPRFSGPAALAVGRAAAAELGGPGAVLAEHDIEGLDGVAVLVEADRAAEALEVPKRRQVVADALAVLVQVFGLARDAGPAHRVDIHADD